MKKIQFFTFILLLVSISLLPTRVATAQLKATLEGHTDIVSSVAFRPNGVMLASASWDQTVRLWNVNTGRHLRTLTGHTSDVTSVVFSPDGQTLASASWDGTIRLWNPNNGKLKRTLTGHAGGVASVAFSPDGQTLASGSADSTIRLWNAKTWKLKSTLTGHTHVVDIIAFSSDGDMLASGSRDTTIRLWNPNNGEHIKTLVGHTSDVLRVMFSPNGQTLASGSQDETVRLWDPNNGQLITTLTNQRGWANPVAFSPDGANLLIGGHGISVWDTEAGEFKKSLAADVGNATSIVFSPDGQMVASGGEDNKVRLWEYNASDYEIPSITTNGMVRLVYFLPDDRPLRPKRVTAFRQLIKDTQQFFADEMQRHGFGRKTFTVETDKDGEPVVHHIDGKFPEEYYYKGDTGQRAWTEVHEHFGNSDLQHIPFVAIDLSHEIINNGNSCGIADISLQGEEVLGGFALIPASGHCFEDNRGDLHRLRAPTHELGHAFGLAHDYRDDSEDAVVGGRGFRMSKCDAEWLSVSRFFNTKSIFRNEPGEIQLLSTSTYSQDATSLRFKVADADGLHQVQLLVYTGGYRLLDCIQVNSKTNTVESVFNTADLVDGVICQIIDMGGNITRAMFPITLDAVSSEQTVLDINSDGAVNISDLISIAPLLERREKNSADVNEDGVINTVDLLLVATGMSSVPRQAVDTFAATDVRKWLNDAKQLRIENEYQQKGIVFLEHLLAEIDLSSKPIRVAVGPLKAIFEGHTDFVSSVAFSPDGQTLASASWDKTIRLWNARTLQRKTLLIGHTANTNSIIFNPDGQTLASGSLDGTIRLWNSQTGKLKRILSVRNEFFHVGLSSLAFSPDGQTLAGGGGDAGGGPDYSIRLWDVHTGQLKTTLAGHTRWVESVAFSPDGQTLASGSRDKTIRLWNPHTGQLKTTLAGHTQEVESVAFSPDGQTLASGSRDRTTRLWNPSTGQLKTTLTGFTDWVSPLAFSPDGEILAGSSQNQRIRLWNTKTGEYINTLKGDMGHISSLAFSPDGQTLASGSEDGTVRLWELIPDDTLSDKIIEDVNGDGVVNILDLVSVSVNFGKTGENIADVNGDGIVNIVDLVKVAGAMGAGAAAPSALPQTLEVLTAADVQHWLTQAQHFGLTDATSQRGILMLQQLLAALIPKETSLLTNYPNPFNPETWIPYQLAKPTNVTLTIYAVDGRVIRRLALGHQPAGMYHSKNRAAYWDGRNKVGEPVASGVYFYTLTAGEFTATRKMLIRK